MYSFCKFSCDKSNCIWSHFDFSKQPHQDGPAYVPVVAILSLGSPVIMNFTPHSSFKNGRGTTGSSNDTISEPAPLHMNSGESLSKHSSFSVALMPRSLLIFKDAAYSGWYLFKIFYTGELAPLGLIGTDILVPSRLLAWHRR